MALVTGYQEMVFEVQPLVRERTQMWARLAGQVVSFEDIQPVQTAFLAMWWEANAAHSFLNVLADVERGNMQWAARWLGLVIYELDHAIAIWQRVLEVLYTDPLVARRLSRFVKDTSTHRDDLVERVAMVRAQTVAFCETYGVVLPEQVLQQTSVVDSDVDTVE